ncbi:OsmC family peroxiredoxin [Acuticoccus sediminis]|uniref:OsmC family peroxiredoxin n=1 Tax=Acuticoccus sediminis TaxID=2184697 RepID=A0A8B2P1T2_9HYPH|nr:OsmC family protein [Acuticoccus sediminis]RAI04106.1 OsmC family peroxiredoxin [Acuticoccus sediminis]
MLRKASAVWQGTLTEGAGTVTTESKALSEVPYSYKTRFEGDQTGTNPEELLGAAHAGCFTMAVSYALQEAGFPVTKAETSAVVELVHVPEGFEIPSVKLTLVAEVPGITEERFLEVANVAKEVCPLSKVLKADITLDAKLVS